jgi:hypothetical protein
MLFDMEDETIRISDNAAYGLCGNLYSRHQNSSSGIALAQATPKHRRHASLEADAVASLEIQHGASLIDGGWAI